MSAGSIAGQEVSTPRDVGRISQNCEFSRGRESTPRDVARIMIDAEVVEDITGWTVARYIAASVEQAKPGPKSSVPAAQNSKYGVHEAAKVMSKSAHTVGAYLAAWNAAAADGLMDADLIGGAR